METRARRISLYYIKRVMPFAFKKTPHISVSCKLVTEQSNQE